MIEYITPRYIIDDLGPFDLDPSAAVGQPWPTARHHLTIEDDGLATKWKGFVWLNPPYGITNQERLWLEKFFDHGNGLALVNAKTYTKWWHEVVFPSMSAIFFFCGRFSFYHVDGTMTEGKTGSPCLIAAGERAVKKLKKTKLKGYLMCP